MIVACLVQAGVLLWVGRSDSKSEEENNNQRHVNKPYCKNFGNKEKKKSPPARLTIMTRELLLARVSQAPTNRTALLTKSKQLWVQVT